MIVYGDHQYRERFSQRVERLRRLTDRLREERPEPPLDDWRALLIQAGELEQAAFDEPASSFPDASLLNEIMAVTDTAAEAFYHCWATMNGEAVSQHWNQEDALQKLTLHLEQLTVEGDPYLTFKVSEGFAFYAVYPEQYCAAALRWAADHREETDRRGAVVGIRSIGTSLSAAVKAALSASSFEVRRLTVRPSGHPHSRETWIDPQTTEGCAWGWVVDEGPGLSGSSMASTAQALKETGLDHSRLVFFPSHPNEPGSQEGEASRFWWTTSPRYVVPTEEMRWEGRTLPDRLAGLTETLLGSRAIRTEDVGWGQWRKALYPDTADWPSVFPLMDVPKYRCIAEDGRAVLWKFAGLTGDPGGASTMAEALWNRLRARADAGWTPAPVGLACGFVVLPWIEGLPLRSEEGSPEVIAHLGAYIADVAGPPLDPWESEEAYSRLNEMLYWNTWEVLGEEMAERARPWSDRAAEFQNGLGLPSCGDGRMAPIEWFRTSDGQLLKMDAAGHEWDHTPVGKQSVLWDVAGAGVEWRLPPNVMSPLLTPLRKRIGVEIPVELLGYYRLAYATFRMGLCAFWSGQTGDPAEQARLFTALSYYRQVVEEMLTPQ